MGVPINANATGCDGYVRLTGFSLTHRQADRFLSLHHAAAQHLVRPAVVDTFDNPNKITDGIDVVDHDVIDLDAGYLVFNRNQQFETIKPVGPEVVAKACFIRQPIGIDSEMPSDDIADLGGNAVIHGGFS